MPGSNNIAVGNEINKKLSSRGAIIISVFVPSIISMPIELAINS